MIWHPGYAPEYFHLFTDTLSLLIGGIYYTYLYNKSSKEQKISDTRIDASLRRILILIGAALGALIGSRLIASLEYPSLFFNPPSLLFYFSVKTVAGGIAGGILGVEILKKLLRIKESTGDIMVGPIALGIIVGRFGCFMLGVRDHTVGIVSSLPWAFNQGDGTPRHPTSLYEILIVLVLWILIELYKRKKIQTFPLGSGLYFRLFIVGYFLFRFFVEFIKPVYPILLGLTAIQWTSALVILSYGFSILRIYRKVRISNFAR
ncbi:MAG: prolipoprotein diacylglyceryl transferase [Candidatus Pacebacteria bacterium]|nr:prolipoprotein diacylglyceryl transferase [Candidatus Paceibacterota bacterium]